MMTLDMIIETHQASLRRFIQKRVSDPFTVDDILQDVLLKVYLSLDTQVDPARLQGWLFRIARNTVIDHYRRQRQSFELSETLTVPEADETPPLERLAGCIPSMINDLAEPYREALQLSGVDGLPQQSIAEQLGLSNSGAKSRVQRGRAQLKELLMKCCRFEFDRRGSLTDYNPHQSCSGHC
jgi:RNA polymerase sigma-70 factor, ECF subfamily